MIKSLLNSLSHRSPWSHKGDFGKVLIIGGSQIYTGSPALSALAALRSGSDLVTIVSPERASNIVASFTPDLITVPLKGKILKPSHIKTLLHLSKTHDAVVIGGGLGLDPRTQKTVSQFLQKLEKPCVIDADGIKSLASYPIQLKSEFLLTPHSYEFYLLTKTNPPKNKEERKKLVKKFASSFGCTILLKGHIDVVSDGKQILINTTGNPYLTKGGTGDTLAGICGALLARGLSPLKAGFLGAYINGKAGDLASRKYFSGMLASDLLEQIPKAMKP